MKLSVLQENWTKNWRRFDAAQQQLLLLTALAVVLLLVYMAAGGGTASAPMTQIALLNPRYAPDTIRVRLSATQITLSKYGDFWFISENAGTDSAVTAGRLLPAAQNRITELLASAALTRPLFVFADTPKNRDALALNEGESSALVFSARAGTVYSALHFGAEDFTRRYISVRSEQSAALYQCANDFGAWLNTDTKLWADMQLVPAVAGINPEHGVQSLTLLAAGERKTLHGDSLERILSYRASALLSAAAVSERRLHDGTEISLVIEGGNGALVTLRILPLRVDGDVPPSYAVLPHISAGHDVPDDAREVIEGLDYALEISAWTYDALQDFFL
jgi:hypothetical protein